MDCDETQAAASEYVDGELSPQMQTRLENHIAWCPGCASFIATFKATVASLKALPRYQAPSHLRETIKNRLHDKS